jgi:hypothetical protein
VNSEDGYRVVGCCGRDFGIDRSNAEKLAAVHPTSDELQEGGFACVMSGALLSDQEGTVPDPLGPMMAETC